jgi:hypothetical protein
MKKLVVFAGVGLLIVPALAKDVPPPSIQVAALSGNRSPERGAGYSTGFEAPYSVGWLGGQQGWTAFGSPFHFQPTITSAGTPYAGIQHLECGYDVNAIVGNHVGGVTPTLSPAWMPGESYTLSVQVKITDTWGADYFVEPGDKTSGAAAARVDFRCDDQKIYVLDYVGTSLAWVATSGSWVVDAYRELKIVQTLGAGGAIRYYYGGTLIHTDADGIPGAATTMNQVTLYSDNYQMFDSGYFDALSLTPEPTSLALLALGGLAAARRRHHAG